MQAVVQQGVLERRQRPIEFAVLFVWAPITRMRLEQLVTRGQYVRQEPNTKRVHRALQTTAYAARAVNVQHRRMHLMHQQAVREQTIEHVGLHVTLIIIRMRMEQLVPRANKHQIVLHQHSPMEQLQ